jgi:hypothetical protein
MKIRQITLLLVLCTTGLNLLTAQNSPVNSGCSSQLIWYVVKAGCGDDIAVSAGSTIDAIDLAYLIDDMYCDTWPYNVISYSDFAGRLMTLEQASLLYCTSEDPAFICAIGFSVDATPYGEFKLIYKNGNSYIVPKTTSDIQDRPLVECIITREIP